MDSLLTVEWVRTEDPKENKHANVIMECQDLLKGSWNTEINHVFREGNKVADGLEKMSLDEQDRTLR